MPTVVVAVEVAVVLAAVFGASVAFAALVNRIAGTPRKYLILSSGVIGVLVYLLTAVVLLKVLPPLRWSNGEASDLRTTLWEYLGILAFLPAAAIIGVWQIVKRRIRANTKVA